MKKFKAMIKKRKLKKSLKKKQESDMCAKELIDLNLYSDIQTKNSDIIFDFFDPDKFILYKKGGVIELDANLPRQSLISISNPFPDMNISQLCDLSKLSIMQPVLLYEKTIKIFEEKRDDKIVIDAEIKVVLPNVITKFESVKSEPLDIPTFVHRELEPKILINEEEKKETQIQITIQEQVMSPVNKTQEINKVLTVEETKAVSSTFESMFTPGLSRLLQCSNEVISKSSCFDMILDLESSTDWKLRVSKPNAQIYLKKGTPSHPKVAVVKALLDIEINVMPENLNFLLYDVDSRKKWDKSSVVEFIEITKTEDVVHYYMLNKAPWPFSDRDFVEKRYMRKYENGDCEVYFEDCAHPEYPEKGKKVTRAKTIFGGQIMRRKISVNTGKLSLQVTFICQADMNGKIPPKALKETLPASMLKWQKTIQKELRPYELK